MGYLRRILVINRPMPTASANNPPVPAAGIGAGVAVPDGAVVGVAVGPDGVLVGVLVGAMIWIVWSPLTAMSTLPLHQWNDRVWPLNVYVPLDVPAGIIS